MSESELGPHLSELAVVVPERAVLFIRTLDTALVGEDLRDPSPAWALIDRGHPGIEAVFEMDPEGPTQPPPGEANEDLFFEQLKQMHQTWQQANEQWRCLTSRR